jgi:hypothetical protein
MIEMLLQHVFKVSVSRIQLGTELYQLNTEKFVKEQE